MLKKQSENCLHMLENGASGDIEQVGTSTVKWIAHEFYLALSKSDSKLYINIELMVVYKFLWCP